MKKALAAAFAAYLVLFAAAANSYVWMAQVDWALWITVPVLLLINVLSGTLMLRGASKQLRICHHGTLMLAVFAASVLISIVVQIFVLFLRIDLFVGSLLLCVGMHFLLFWNGIICVYLTSYQLGIRQRVIGAVCGMIPIVNVIVLGFMLLTLYREVLTEWEKARVNERRKNEQVCKTRYPILLVHGVFFRDSKVMNYWGRIPEELERNGAVIYYGNHQSAAAVAHSAQELTDRIKTIVRETGCEKLNIIAHSKGGLDCRYAISLLDAAPYVASLTTVNTPHKGCMFADYLLQQIPDQVENGVAKVYNATMQQLGDPNPDFLAAVYDLTASACTMLDAQMVTPPGIFCQSVGSVQKQARNGQFPLNYSYHLVKKFDGDNDGLVSVEAFPWGQQHTLLTTDQKRGISHGDVVDLNRENLPGFDVREFYVNLVRDLKNRGL